MNWRAVGILVFVLALMAAVAILAPLAVIYWFAKTVNF